MKERTFLIFGGIGDLVRLVSCKSSIHANIVCISFILDAMSRLFSFVYAVIACVVSYHTVCATVSEYQPFLLLT